MDSHGGRGTANAHGVAGRLERALRNFLETFPLFATAVLLVQITGRNGRMSAIGAVSPLSCLVSGENERIKRPRFARMHCLISAQLARVD
jgi:hypothetical protein